MTFPSLLTEKYLQGRRDSLRMTHQDSPQLATVQAEVAELEARFESEKRWHVLRSKLKAAGYHHKPEQGDVWLEKIRNGWLKHTFADVIAKTGFAIPR